MVGGQRLGLHKRNGKFVTDREQWRTWTYWINAKRFQHRAHDPEVKDAEVTSWVACSD